MKAETINKRASELRANGEITGRVTELAESVSHEFVLNTADLLREAARLAFSDPRKIMHADGRVRLPIELDADTARAISSFKIDEYGRIEYKFWDKNSAIERLFKHKGLFEVDNKQKIDPLIAFAQTLQGDIAGPGALQIPEDDD
jgi:phage terminase small subunit